MESVLRAKESVGDDPINDGFIKSIEEKARAYEYERRGPPRKKEKRNYDRYVEIESHYFM
jgi:hypothetical protein